MAAPLLYEVNTRVWLRELSSRSGEKITLASVPDTEIEKWKACGFTHIWLMGLWTIGPQARAIAVENWKREWASEFPSREEDVHGSPYAIKEYGIDADIGEPITILLFRDRLRAHGMKLVLDFIPNHLGIDTPELQSYPARFVQGKNALPGTFEVKTKFGKRIFAHGKDPYFPPWTDTVQMDYRVPDTQMTMTAVAQTLAVFGDGLRCDMAMLLIPEIFQSTWKDFPPATLNPVTKNFWKHALPRVKEHNPGVDLIAEAYWGREDELQQAGFDYTYNKRVTDFILRGQFAELSRFLLNCSPEYLRKSVHFLENHDEPRVASELSLQRHRAAAVLITGLPGMPLIHDGQLEGRKKFARIQMSARPDEPADPEISAFYRELLSAVQESHVRKGKGDILKSNATTPEKVAEPIAIQWTEPGGAIDLVLVNLSGEAAKVSVPLTTTAAPMTFYSTGDAGAEFKNETSTLKGTLPAESGFILRFQ